MRFSGRLKSWNTDRGYGFIEPRRQSRRQAFWGTVLLNVAAFVVYRVIVKPAMQS